MIMRKILLLAGPLSIATALLAPPAIAATYHVPSDAKTMHRGIISPTLPPALRIKSGDTVTIDTVSHSGLVDEGPVKFFAKAGIAEKNVLKDAVTASTLTRTPGFGGHVLTGPIYIDGAEPGDMLEIRIKKVTPRVPYGVNNAGSGGAAPDMIAGKERLSNTIKYDIAKKIAYFKPGITFPLRPFMGIMAVAPAKQISSQAPGLYGGNMDFERLQAGSTLYLPVLVKGAMFVTGDSHAAQGDGEVSGNALEASMAPTLEFIVHKGEGATMTMPMAEDKDNYYILGMDPDLNKALSNTIKETVKFLGKKFGLSPADAYSLCSTAIDFSVAQAVDRNLTMYAKIPKSFFQKSAYKTQ
jgi:acetamidase/formamidase